MFKLSNTTTALLIKFVLTFGAAWFALGLVDTVPFTWILTIAVIGTILNYILGDLIVLPALGNVVASIGDGIMAALVAYMVALFTIDFAPTWGSLITFGVIVAVVEFFFHMYLKKDNKVAPKEK